MCPADTPLTTKLYGCRQELEKTTTFITRTKLIVQRSTPGRSKRKKMTSPDGDLYQTWWPEDLYFTARPNQLSGLIDGTRSVLTHFTLMSAVYVHPQLGCRIQFFSARLLPIATAKTKRMLQNFVHVSNSNLCRQRFEWCNYRYYPHFTMTLTKSDA